MSSASDGAQRNDDSRGSPGCAALPCSAQSRHPFICFVAAFVFPTCYLLTKPNQTNPTLPRDPNANNNNSNRSNCQRP